ncbi:TonB-dependent receptor [Rhodohalobacter sp. SW132]|uniref:SusC/RagA family TonB-linked outer membrane protein n=1 Tax=Rhodohalobacter sp. SW132 TaxID=2293433 RepID=UPI000E22DC28|nr:TonB-dependent receptor [Rhodohalobacter sp. SW132]REL38942.1 TonB-dependent receptor [Rhodohalobacter sp. SW132]
MLISTKFLFFAQLLFLLTAGNLFAQQTITGTVTDAEGEPLIGATVVISDRPDTGASTDIDGRFSLSAEPGDVLLVTFIGYRTSEVLVDERTEYEIILELDDQLLGELVVVGYGIQQRSDLTGSIASISGEQIQNQPVASIDGALQGRASGVFVSTPSGTPGAGITMNIRGQTSISGSSEPLYVIDGVPIISEDLSGLFSGGQATNSLADLNPNDIESIEILKDASATAIYGSRGANGVVLISTKRGQAGQSNIGFSMYTGFQQVTNTIDMHSSQEFLELMDDAARQDNRALGTNYPENYVSSMWGYPDPSDPDIQNTVWYDEIFRTAAISNYELNASGGTESTRYFTSLSYFDQEGTQYGTGFERISARLNLDTEVTDWLDFGASVTLNRTLQDRVINDNSLYGVVINTLAGDPLMPVFEEDGSYADPFAYFGWWMLDNPLLIANEYQRFTNTTRGIGSIFGVANISENLSLRSSLNIDYTSLEDEAYTPIISRESQNAQRNGFGTFGTTQDFTWLIENYLSYVNTFGDRHNLNGVLGTSFQQSNRDFSSINAQGFPNDQFIKLSAASQVTSASTSGTSWGLASYFFRGNYSFDDRYLFTVTGRLDGSSRFGDDFRYGFFPSGSFAWRMSNESFMQNQDIFSELKPRISYGITGNQEGIGNFASRGLYGVSDYRAESTLVPTQMINPTLSWESTRQIDVGIDIGLFDDRINMSADYFVKDTDDLLLNRLVPGISGFSSVTDNIGRVQNRGFEFDVRGVVFSQADFSWTSSFNISFIRNEVKELEVDEQVLSDSHILAEGHPIGTFYLIDHEGVDPETGNMLWIDRNEDGVIDSDDRLIVGNAQPDFFGGFSNSFAYRGFDLNVLFQFTYGNDIFNHSRASYENLGWSRLGTGGFILPDGNNHSLADNRWMEPGDETDIPRASLTNDNWREYSSRWLEDGSYLRLKTLTLGYNFSPEITQRLGMSNLRIYFQGQNLLTFTSYTGLDPEVNQNARNPLLAGSDFGTLPQSRTISFGINLEF